MARRKCTMVLIATLMALVAALAGSDVSAGNDKVLYDFHGYDGSTPDQDLTFDAQGNLWGTTLSGGEPNHGTVFKLTPGPNGAWSETFLSFQDDHKVGGGPKGGVIMDRAGNIYGTTAGGGPNGHGAIFELTPGPNGTWSESVLHAFGQDNGMVLEGDGSGPEGDLVMDKAGNIYGTTHDGGACGPGQSPGGTVFELTRAPNGAWSYARLFSFCKKGGGFFPTPGVAIDAAGNLYGTTSVTDLGNGGGDGVVFMLTRGASGDWAETVLHTFHNPNLRDSWGRLLWPPDGWGFKSPLVIDAAGSLYGTTSNGGICPDYGVGLQTGDTGCFGMVYKLAPGSNGTWTETILHTFTGGAKPNKDGSGPVGRLLLDMAGNFYGVTKLGGTGVGGTVFKLSPDANGRWTETVLHNFPLLGPEVAKEGTGPLAGLAHDAAGNLFGVAAGSQFGLVYEIPVGPGPAVSFDVQPGAAPAPSSPAPSHPAIAQATPLDRFDVLGVKINMPLVAARKVLGAALPQPVTETCNSMAAYKDGPALLTHCLLHDGRPMVDPNPAYHFGGGAAPQQWFHRTEDVDLDLAGTNGSEQVVCVSRGMKFPKGQEATFDKVVAGLKQKYGETSSSEEGGQGKVVMKWIYDQRGRLITRDSALWNRCGGMNSLVDGSNGGYVPFERLAGPTVDWQYYRDCGSFIVAEVDSIYGNPQIAGSFRIVMGGDQPVLFDALVERDKYFRAAIKAKQDSDAQKAKGEVKY
ncbi:MAG: choice-of-anchor tandem repeat GloVer-containing protein [Terriglobia bacterium]